MLLFIHSLIHQGNTSAFTESLLHVNDGCWRNVVSDDIDLAPDLCSGIRNLGTAPTDSLLLSISWHWRVDLGRTASYLHGWVETLASGRGSMLLLLYISAGKTRQAPMLFWVLRIPTENWYYLEYNLEISRTFGIWIGVHKLFLCYWSTLWSGASHLNFLSLSFHQENGNNKYLRHRPLVGIKWVSG